MVNFKNDFKPAVSAISVISLLILTLGFFPMPVQADSTGFQSPTSTHSPNNWNNTNDAFSSNDQYATSNDESDEQGYSNFGFSIPSGSAIDGIEVAIEAKASDSSGCEIRARLSWNNGSSHTSQKDAAITGTDAVYTLGGTLDTWGRSWATGEFTNANFVVKIEFDDVSSNDCSNGTVASVDHLQVNVHFTPPAPPVANPPLTESCGLDIALVLDSSGSISTTELNQMKDAFEAFVAAFLPGTPTLFSVTDFDTTATVLQGFTDNTALINSAINAPTSGGFTNWEDGLLKAQSTFDPRLDHPNMVIFASDGNPNRKGNPAQSVSESDAVDAAVIVANDLKNDGTRILALGIGDNLDVPNLNAISGPNVNTGITSDVITSNFATLAEDLAELAQELCGGTITVHKIIDEDGDLGTTGDQIDGEGWTFDVGGNIEVTDSEGLTAAVELDQGTYNVTETLETGYEFLSASCEGATDNGSLGELGVFGIEVGNQDIVSCTFYNMPGPGILTVYKQVTNDDDGQAVASDFTIEVENGSPASFPGDAGGTQVTIPAGASFSVSEPDSLGYGITLDGDCSGVMPPGGQLACTVINDDPEPTTGSLTVVKRVINDNGGTATESDFQAKIDGDNVPWSQAQSLFAGTYTLSETANVSDYEASGWSCQGGSQNSNEITIEVGEIVVCTITNDDIPPSLTLVKQAEGGPADETDFTLMADGPTLISGDGSASSDSSFEAGTYILSETGVQYYDPGGWVCQGDAQNTGNQITLGVGQSATCTITNTFNPPPPEVDLEVQKTVDDNTADVGQTIVYTITVTNRGPDEASNVLVTESMPECLTFVDYAASQGVYNSTTGDWEVGQLQNGATATLDIEVTVDCEEGGELVNLAFTTHENDSNEQNDSDSETVNVNTPEEQPQQFTLTVTTSGEGDGLVTDDDDPNKINCDSKTEEDDCTETYASGTEVTLTADPDDGSNFDSSWSGACTGNDLTCQITMNGDKSVNAHFSLNPSSSPPPPPPSGGGGGGGNAGPSYQPSLKFTAVAQKTVGNSYAESITIRNEGNTTLDAGILEIVFPAVLELSSANPNYLSFAENRARWNIPAIETGRSFQIDFTVVPQESVQGIITSASYLINNAQAAYTTASEDVGAVLGAAVSSPSQPQPQVAGAQTLPRTGSSLETLLLWLLLILILPFQARVRKVRV